MAASLPAVGCTFQAFAAIQHPPYPEIVEAVRQTADALSDDPSFDRAEEFCGVLRMGVGSFLRRFQDDDGHGCESHHAALAQAAKDGIEALLAFEPRTRAQIQRFDKYLKSCRFRWNLLRTLKEEGVAAANVAITRQREKEAMTGEPE